MKTFSLDFPRNSELVASKNLKYNLLYFGVHFGGINSRGILAYANADWTPTYPPNWGTDKAEQPFELIPVLTVIHPDNNSNDKELVLSECVAIDIFLAKQFGLHGENAWEEAVINAFFSHSNSMFFQGVMSNFYWESLSKTEEKKTDYLENKLLKGSLSDWARIHEEHLKSNGFNGHYVGNRTTLADIRTTTLVDGLSKIIGKERVARVINETATPGIVNVVKNVESHPSYKSWIESEEYKKLDKNSVDFVKNHHPELHPELYPELAH